MPKMYSKELNLVEYYFRSCTVDGNTGGVTDIKIGSDIEKPRLLDLSYSWKHYQEYSTLVVSGCDLEEVDKLIISQLDARQHTLNKFRYWGDD